MTRMVLNKAEVQELRSQGLTWAEIGREIARRQSRVMPYTARAVQRVGLLRPTDVVETAR